MLGVSAQDVTKNINDLPGAAQNFIRDHYSSSQVDWIKVDKEAMGMDKYEVQFKDGTNIEFNQNGDWRAIESRDVVIPSMVTSSFTPYLTTNYPNERVVSVKRDGNGYDVKLSNRKTLKFNDRGEFMRLDD